MKKVLIGLGVLASLTLLACLIVAAMCFSDGFILLGVINLALAGVNIYTLFNIMETYNEISSQD